MPPPDRTASNAELDSVWRALSSPTRRAILELLKRHPRTTGELWLALRPKRLSRFAVMQHLGVLEEAGLVVSRRRGRTRYNVLNPVPLQRLYHRWIRRFEGLAAPPLLRFKQPPTAAAGRSPPRRPS